MAVVAGATLAITGVSVIAPTAANAATLTVTTTADSGSGSLRDALASAVDGDTIKFAPSVTGTISLSSPLTVVDQVTITGPGENVLAVDGNNKVQDLIVDTRATSVTVSGLTFTNGSGLNGGAILVGADLALNRVRVTNSTATGNGGGIYSDGAGSLSVVDSTVSGNSAINGGGIFAFARSSTGLLVHASTITGNTARSGDGAGIYLGGQADGNDDGDNCGECCDNECCIECCEVCRVPAAARVLVPDQGTTPVGGAGRISNTTIAANTAPVGGAVFLADLDQNTVIRSSTISDNLGGGLTVSTSYTAPVLAADLVAGNTTDCASGPWNDVGYNIDGDASCALSEASSQSGTSGIAAALGGLADNGGPTQTEALAAASDPAHDVVPATFTAPGALTTVCGTPDQRGVVPDAAPCDVGAYQLVTPKITARASSDHPRTSYGWFNSSVTVAFHCVAGSPVLTVSCSPPVDVTTEGKHKVVGVATQQDGQTTSKTRRIRIDETAPTVRLVDGAAKCSDDRSGIAKCKAHRKQLDNGAMRYRLVAVDKAGNRTVRGVVQSSAG